MILTWDERKRQANMAKHGLDFADLGEAFFESALAVPTKLGRYRVIGRGGGEAVVVVVFRPLGRDALSIISMRPASRRERAYVEENA